MELDVRTSNEYTAATRTEISADWRYTGRVATAQECVQNAEDGRMQKMVYDIWKWACESSPDIYTG